MQVDLDKARKNEKTKFNVDNKGAWKGLRIPSDTEIFTTADTKVALDILLKNW